MREVTVFGGFFFFILLSMSLLFIGELDLFSNFFWAFFLLHCIPMGIRMIYFKERPQKIKFNNFGERMVASSFPSVHTERAFFIGTMFLGVNLLLGLVFVTLATTVGLSRVYLKRHYMSDVIVGAILGIAIGLLFSL